MPCEISLSKPSKMPGHAYSIPATKCITGSKLRKVPGSVCSGCYAMKGRYMFPNVKRAMERRLRAIKSNLWVSNMIDAVQATGDDYFRWHDSGDLQSTDHLHKIVLVARALPGVKFWLPTRELGIISAYKAIHGPFPDNLNVRVSAAMIGQVITTRQGYTSSSVQGKQGPVIKGYACPSGKQGNKCLDCRACWNKDIENVVYVKH